MSERDLHAKHVFDEFERRDPAELYCIAGTRQRANRVHEGIILGFLALLRLEMDGNRDALLRTRVHVFLSEGLGLLGLRGEQRLHAKEAKRICDQLPQPAGDLTAVVFKTLAAVERAANGYAFAEHYLQKALAALRGTASCDNGEAGSILLELGMLSLDRIRDAGPNDLRVADYLRSADSYLDGARAVLDQSNHDKPVSLAFGIRLLALRGEALMRASDLVPIEHSELRNRLLARAESILRDVLASVGSHKAMDAEWTATLLVRLAQVLLRRRRPRDASDILHRLYSDGIQRSNLDAAFAIALMFHYQDSVESLIAICRHISESEDQSIRELSSKATEAVAIGAVTTMRHRSLKCLALLVGFANDRPEVAAGMLDITLRLKGTLEEAERSFWKGIYSGSDAGIANSCNTLLAKRRLLSAKLRAGDANGIAQLIDELDHRAGGLAVASWGRAFQQNPDQARRFADLKGFANDLLAGNTAWAAVRPNLSSDDSARPSADAIAAVLSTHTAYVEFIKVHEYDPRRDRFLSESEYWAIVVTAASKPRVRRLGLSSTLESRVTAELDALIAAGTGRLEPARQLRAMSALYAVVWAPIEPALSDVTTVIVSPDGVLATVPFAALVGPDLRFLVERFTFTLVSSGRVLLQPRPERSGRPTSGRAVVVADPDYSISPQSYVHRATTQRCTDPLRPYLERLTETSKELIAIKKVLGADADYLMDAMASKSNILRVQGPRVLHFATHGLFQQNQWPGAVGDSEDACASTGAYAHYVRTLSAAGLALAGWNTPSDDPDDDGFLTAFDVVGMDLAGTDLVMLSACNTGRGVLAASEGLLGLSRSFLIAGAKAVVVSLWKLSDREARKQMELFYSKYIGSQEHPATVLASVQRDRIRWFRRAGITPPPAFWGPLTVYGVPSSALREGCA